MNNTIAVCMLYDSYRLVLVPPRSLVRTTNKETMIGARRSVLKSRNRTALVEKEGDGVATIVGHRSAQILFGPTTKAFPSCLLNHILRAMMSDR